MPGVVVDSSSDKLRMARKEMESVAGSSLWSSTSAYCKKNSPIWGANLYDLVGVGADELPLRRHQPVDSHDMVLDGKVELLVGVGGSLSWSKIRQCFQQRVHPEKRTPIRVVWCEWGGGVGQRGWRSGSGC